MNRREFESSLPPNLLKKLQTDQAPNTADDLANYKQSKLKQAAEQPISNHNNSNNNTQTPSSDPSHYIHDHPNNPSLDQGSSEGSEKDWVLRTAGERAEGVGEEEGEVAGLSREEKEEWMTPIQAE